MYSKTYEYYVNPQKRRFCSDAQGTPITDLPTFYFGERPVFTMTFPDNVLTEGEKLVFVMDNENRFLDSRSTTGLAPVMAWCVHEITAEDVESKSIDLELYCFGRKYADVINGHDNAVTCILSLFIKSIDENLNCTFSTLATTLAHAEPTIVSPDCVFDELPIDMYLTRDEMNALIAEVEAIQREAIAKAEQARQSAAIAEAAAQEASQIAKDLKPLKLDYPPTTSTIGSVGQLAVWHDGDNNKDHLYHLCFISTSDSATLYHWEECVLVSQGNVAGGYPILDANGKIASAQLPPMDYIPTIEKGTANGVASLNKSSVVPTSQLPQVSNNVATNWGLVRQNINGSTGVVINSNGYLTTRPPNISDIDARSQPNKPITAGSNLDYVVRSVLSNITEIPAATSDYSLVDSSATTNNHSHVYSHSPESAPTYRLPQVTNTAIAHYIELTVDFTAVQTYSFLDYQGEPIVPLFTPSIAVGDVYTFKMEYSAIKAKWLIYPQKQGAVADDFVMRGEVGAANGVAGLDGNVLLNRQNIPIASSSGNTVSLVGGVGLEYGQWGGLFLCSVLSNRNALRIRKASHLVIDQRIASDYWDSGTGGVNNCWPIVPANLNYAVTAAITDSNHITLTDAQKAVAQEVFGVPAPLLGTAAPTTSTVGVVGQLYVDTVTSKTYTCVSIGGTEQEPEYNWSQDAYMNNVVPKTGGTFTGAVHVGTSSIGVNLSNTGIISAGYSASATERYSIAVGDVVTLHQRNSIAVGYAISIANAGNDNPKAVFGKFNKDNSSLVFSVGWGTSNSNKRNILELNDTGVFYIGAGYQQGITVIPAATTAYTLAEGVQSHTPEAASVYTLPEVTDNTRSHECILTIKFSSAVLTYEFQDSAGTTLVPLPLNGDIEAGSVVTFLCRYNPLLAQWVIYPVMDGKEAQE